jgi:hypothetical protein
MPQCPWHGHYLCRTKTFNIEAIVLEGYVLQPPVIVFIYDLTGSSSVTVLT